MSVALRRAWALLRELTGDDAYERYLEHWRARHALDGTAPLDRVAFYREELQRKWDGVRRCC
jgi:uncharacterized short protein YbdD (DUF466 family)